MVVWPAHGSIWMGSPPRCSSAKACPEEDTVRLSERIAANSRTVPLIEGEATVDRVYEAMMAGLRAAAPPAQVAADGDSTEGWQPAVAILDQDREFFEQLRGGVTEGSGSLRADA